MTENETLLAKLERSERRLLSLLRVCSSLAKAARPQEVYESVLEESVTTLNARAGTVTLLEGDTLHIVAFRGQDAHAIETLKYVLLTAHDPVAEAVRRKESLYFPTALARNERYAKLVPFFNAATNASVYLPLLVAGEALGTLTLSFSGEQGFDTPTKAFMTSLADTCAQALHRALLFDTTQRCEERFQREQPLNALRHLTEKQQRFVADAAHELRAPLTSLRGNLDLLTRYQDIPKSEQQEMLGDLQQEAVRLSTLVEDLLELARGDSGLKLKKERVNLSELLLGSWQKIQAFNTSHTFELENLPTVFVLGDSDRLKQLALILLENATKYTPEGGIIRLGLVPDKNEALFYVRDTGIGIGREDLEHVFERFYRADKARTHAENPGGTGLGLPIAEWIIKEHGGKVWLSSEPGKGTTAFVRLPLDMTK